MTPSVHYQQVRDSWAGVRTPDGRYERRLVHRSLRLAEFRPATPACHWRIKGTESDRFAHARAPVGRIDMGSGIADAAVGN